MNTSYKKKWMIAEAAVAYLEARASDTMYLTSIIQKNYGDSHKAAIDIRDYILSDQDDIRAGIITVDVRKAEGNAK